MPIPNTPIATDSATALHDLIGDDATATFESDPKFIGSNPTETASSENLDLQRDTDDVKDSDDEIEDADEEDSEDEEDDEDEEEEQVEAEADAQRTSAEGATDVRQ